VPIVTGVCITLTMDFWKENKFQFLSLFYLKTFVSLIFHIIRKFHLQKVGVAAVFLLIKVVSKFDFEHSLDKR